MTEYNVKNVSNWINRNEGKGYSESYWVLNPMNMEKFLLKFPQTPNTGGHWVEKIVSELGSDLGLNMPEIDLVEYNDRKGCISHFFLGENQVLKEGKEILDVCITKDKNREKYTIENIIDTLKKYKLENEFIEMLLFDAFVGQQDRHEQNWGIIINNDVNGVISFSPIYDNSSALTRELPMSKVKQMLSDDMYYSNYINNSKSMIKIDGDEYVYYLLESGE